MDLATPIDATRQSCQRIAQIGGIHPLEGRFDPLRKGFRGRFAQLFQNGPGRGALHESESLHRHPAQGRIDPSGQLGGQMLHFHRHGAGTGERQRPLGQAQGLGDRGDGRPDQGGPIGHDLRPRRALALEGRACEGGDQGTDRPGSAQEPPVLVIP